MYVCSKERPLGLFEVLARNRQSAVGLASRTRSAQEQPTRVFTIPPRQRLSSPNRLVSRRRNFTHLINTHTQRERRKELKKERETQNQACKKETRNTASYFFLFYVGPISRSSSPIPIRNLLIFLYSPTQNKRSHRSQKHQSWPPREDS